MNQIEIYKSANSEIEIRVQFERETVWLSQKQMAELFEKDTDTVGLHLKNIFRECELNENSTTEFFSVVQKEGKREVTRSIKYYNLDAIISVGYRVNSKRGTQFRQWATQRLKDYLIKGYAINQKLLQQSQEKYEELKRALTLASKTGKEKKLTSDESKGILKILESYAFGLDMLDRYDHQSLTILPGGSKETKKLTYNEAISQINIWRKKHKTSRLFGNQKDDSFKSSINTIYQTYGGKELYPSLAEKAAHLLYFIVKNHSFTDGNKRIGAALFIYFLDLNNVLYKSGGLKRIDDNALVALTLMIANSKPKEKDIMISLTANLIEQ